MEESQQVKTKRRFPLNLYNKLEQRLKNKSDETLENTTLTIFVSSMSTSPGRTFCLNRALLIPAKYAVLPFPTDTRLC